MAEEVVQTRKKRTTAKSKAEPKTKAKKEEVVETPAEAPAETTVEEEPIKESKSTKTKTKASDTPAKAADESKDETVAESKTTKAKAKNLKEVVDLEANTTELADNDEDLDAVNEETEKIRDRVSNTKSESDLMKDGKTVIPASKKMRRVLYSESDIIPLGDKLQFQSEGALRKEKYVEIMSSLRSHNVLTGKIYSTKTIDGMICAVVSYGPFDVLLPQEFFLTEKDKGLIEQEKDEVSKDKRARRLVNERIGSEVDFIIKKVDEESGIAIGDRLSAMKVRQKAWFFSTDRNGEYLIKVGTKVEARVVSANTNSVTVEFGGLEFKLRQNDIAYTRIASVQEEYPVGTTVPIMFMAIERQRVDKKITLKVLVSMKEALPDTREREFNRYNKNDLVRATVTGIESFGIFARLGGKDGKQDILCAFPDIPKYSTDTSVLPNLNDDVLVKILHKDEEDEDGNKVYRISGVIIRNLR